MSRLLEYEDREILEVLAEHLAERGELAVDLPARLDLANCHRGSRELLHVECGLGLADRASRCECGDRHGVRQALDDIGGSFARIDRQVELDVAIGIPEDLPVVEGRNVALVPVTAHDRGAVGEPGQDLGHRVDCGGARMIAGASGELQISWI